MCQTVRQKEQFLKSLEQSRQNVRTLENKFRNTLKNVRRQKLVLGQKAIGTSLLDENGLLQYKNDIEFTAQPAIINGGKVQKFVMYPKNRLKSEESIEQLHLFQKVNQKLKQQQINDDMRDKIAELLRQINQLPPLTQEEQFIKKFKVTKSEDKREKNQSALKLKKEFEQSQRLGPRFFENTHVNFIRNELDKSRNPYEWRTSSSLNKQASNRSKLNIHDETNDYVEMSSKNQKQEVLKKINQQQQKYVITKQSLKSKEKKQQKEQQQLLQQQQQQALPMKQNEEVQVQSMSSFNEWGQISLKKFELNIK